MKLKVTKSKHPDGEYEAFSEIQICRQGVGLGLVRLVGIGKTPEEARSKALEIAQQLLIEIQCAE